jgi:3-oxoacyl-[acyl-carrier protein] reductase
MLAAEGAKVVLAARRESELERVADGIRRRGGVAVPVVTDLADDDSLVRLLATARDECGPVDVLVNNAGYAVWKPLEETTIAEWDRTFAVNVRARPACAPRCWPACRRGGSGGSSTLAVRPVWLSSPAWPRTASASTRCAP